LIGFANASAHQDFLRILALLLSAEPLVHLGIHGTIRMSPGESLGGYTAWRRVQDGASFLNLVGLSVPQVTTWHQDLYLLNN
jgi:hypothetical protein